MESNLYVWSVPLKPIRNILPTTWVSWVHKWFNLPVHTFATIGEQWDKPPSEKEGISGYWYCAGDFCNTNEKGINRFYVGVLNIDYAYCLVKPDIPQHDKLHEAEVIGGTYGFSYVCHNIANRILYSTGKDVTLANTMLPQTGYKIVVNSHLGIYGNNKREWDFVIDKCSTIPIDPKMPRGTNPLRTTAEEIDLIHLRAAKGRKNIERNITEALREIDENYFYVSVQFFNQLDNKEIDKSKFNKEMEILVRNTILATEKIVGSELTAAIYGDYNCSQEVNSNSGSGGLSGSYSEIEYPNQKVKNIGHMEG